MATGWCIDVIEKMTISELDIWFKRANKHIDRQNKGM